jgi:predicted nuclease with TOPRIM domain
MSKKIEYKGKETDYEYEKNEAIEKMDSYDKRESQSSSFERLTTTIDELNEKIERLEAEKNDRNEKIKKLEKKVEDLENEFKVCLSTQAN